MRNEQHQIRWDNQNLRLADIIPELGEAPEEFNWNQVLDNAEPCEWEDLEEAMKRVSLKFPGTLLSVVITDTDGGDNHIQHHQDGRCYEALEIRMFPDFQETLLR